MTKQADGLQIEQDLRFQRREWAVQRVSWGALFLFVAAAGAGLFGNGPLSAGRAGQAGDAIWVEYERFVRVGADTRMRLHLRHGSGGDPLAVRVNRDYFDGVRVGRFVPEPDRAVVGPDDVTLFFPAQPDQSEAIVVVDLEPRVPGRRTVRIGTERQPGVAFTQLTYF